MEMHQIRYFLAAARTLNFTRAAEECNVAQPSLTRAIHQLEAELGGDLFRREQKRSHLTDLGLRMQPMMQQCYDMAQGAKQLAGSIKRGEVASLRVGLSHSVDIALLLPCISEIQRTFTGLELRLVRGSAPEIAEMLKQGELDIGITGKADENWARFDVWPLFSENFSLVVNQQHRLANKETASLDDVAGERLLLRTNCEHLEQASTIMTSRDIIYAHRHELSCDYDLLSLLKANLGMALVPQSIVLPEGLARLPLNEPLLQRTVCLYAVAGRLRSGLATTFIKQLNAADWSRVVN